MTRRRARWRDNAEFGQMVARMLAAYGRRVGGADMEDLAQLVELRAELDQIIGGAIAGVRAAGYSWADVGEVLGVTRQAAQQRWGQAEPATKAPAKASATTAGLVPVKSRPSQ